MRNSLRAFASLSAGTVLGTGASVAYADAGATNPEPIVNTTKPLRAVVIGGGCAGSLLAHSMDHVCDVILIDKKPYFEFTPMLKDMLLGGLGMEGGPSTISEASKELFRQYFVSHDFYLERTRVVVDEVVDVTPTAVILKSGRRVDFDMCFFCMGSKYAAPWRGSTAASVTDRVNEMKRYHKMIETKDHIAVIGGGAVGVESACLIRDTYPDKKVTLVHSRQLPLNTHAAKVGHYAAKRLAKKGVDVHTLSRVTDVAYSSTTKDFTVKYADANRDGGIFHPDVGGSIEGVGYVLDCRGLKPNTAILKNSFASNLDSRGFVKVNRLNQLEGHPNIFALGDIASQPSARGREGGLVYVVDHVTGVTNLLKEGFHPQETRAGIENVVSNEIFHLPYPMQLIKLGSYDQTGTAQLLGQVTGVLGWFASRQLHATFLEPYDYPRFKPTLDKAARARHRTYVHNMKSNPADYEYFQDK